jgi:topoisomerase IA-like protein
MPNGPQKITGISFDPTLCQSDLSITDEEVKKLLTTSAKTKKPNKKKKPAAGADGAKEATAAAQ